MACRRTGEQPVRVPGGDGGGKLTTAVRVELEWGDTRARLKLGGIPEEDLPPAAEVLPEFQWIWRAWRRLSSDRPNHGGGFGPSVPGDIPWSLLLKWAEHHEMTKAEFYLLDRCCQAMDREYRAWTMEQAQRTTPTNVRR
jgi:hypothetical protein